MLTDTEKKPKAVVVSTYTDDKGREVLVYDNGAKKDKATGYWISPPPKAKITHELAREFAALRRARGIEAQLRGLAKANDVEPSDVPEELIEQAGSAVEAITQHMAQTFMGSRNLRGMGEVYDKLISPMVGDRREKHDETPAAEVNVTVLLAQFVQMRQLTETPVSASQESDVIDGSIAEDKDAE